MIRNIYTIPGLLRQAKFNGTDGQTIRATVELEVCEYINEHPDLLMTKNHRFYTISPETLRSSRRTKELVFARHLVLYLLCHYSSYTLKAIGLLYNRVDHTTVMHSRDLIQDLLRPQSQDDFREYLERFLTKYGYNSEGETVKTYKEAV
jgi:chromosomal replication initiation ATPase DnaA